MSWKTMDVREQRVRFVVAAIGKEKPFSVLCQEFGIWRPTGIRWRERYEREGLAGIAERSRRPHPSPTRTGAEMEHRVSELRGRYPDWGARKLQVRLGGEGVEKTSRTIHRILLRHDLVRESQRRRQALPRLERSAANELWPMDFKSPKGWNSTVGPLSVLDDHSRYRLVLRAVWSTQAELVREQWESGFLSCGVPPAMRMDHGIPWWSTRAPGGATGLTLWRMKQGMERHGSGRRHPQTQGKVERFPGERERALPARGAARKEPQDWRDAFGWEHNHVRPHEALGMLTPAQRWHPSEHRDDPQPPRWEYPSGARVGKVDRCGKLRMGGRNWNISKALCGEWVQLEPGDDRVLVYYGRTLIRELDFRNQRSTAVERWFPSQ